MKSTPGELDIFLVSFFAVLTFEHQIKENNNEFRGYNNKICFHSFQLVLHGLDVTNENTFAEIIVLHLSTIRQTEFLPCKMFWVAVMDNNFCL
jgi:hypothetical protein